MRDMQKQSSANATICSRKSLLYWNFISIERSSLLQEDCDFFFLFEVKPCFVFRYFTVIFIYTSIQSVKKVSF